MMLAWFSESLMTASCSSSRVSNNPPFASKQDEYSIVSSMDRYRLSRSSSSRCTRCVPQMKRTEAAP